MIKLPVELGVISYLVVDDVGTVINPQLLKGQITGGVAQGLGQALMEQVVYDPSNGQLVSASFMDYAMPRATELPPVQVISQPIPTSSNPLGVKGAGEAGTGTLAAVMNAFATRCPVWELTQLICQQLRSPYGQL